MFSIAADCLSFLLGTLADSVQAKKKHQVVAVNEKNQGRIDSGLVHKKNKLWVKIDFENLKVLEVVWEIIKLFFCSFSKS